MKRIVFLVALLVPSAALGQIVVVPAEQDRGGKIVATVSATVPEGAIFDGGWRLSCPDGTACQAWYEPIQRPNSIVIGSPRGGDYVVTYSGFWLLLKEVTFKDGDGNTVTIQSYLGHGYIEESSPFKIVGGGDDPQPPPPDERYQMVLIYRSSQFSSLTEGQKFLLTSAKERSKLVKDGHTVLAILEADLLPSVDSNHDLHPFVVSYNKTNKPMPAVVWAPKSGGQARVMALPGSAEELLEDLQ